MLKHGGSSLLAVALIGLLWGLNWPAVKILLTEIEPLTIRAVSFPAAALLLALIAKAMGETLHIPKGERIPVCIAGFFLIFGFNALTSLGQVVVETSRAAIIAYTMPALTAGLAAVFLGDRIGPRLLAALALGMGGLAVLASEDIGALIAEPAGPAIMLLAALSWSIGNVFLKSRRWSLSPLALSVWFFGVSCVYCWPLALAFETPWTQPWPSPQVLWTLAFHILGPMITCYFLWTVLLGKLPATVAAISTLTAPVVAVLSAILILGDPLTWQKGLSLTMIVLSVAVTAIRPPENTA